MTSSTIDYADYTTEGETPVGPQLTQADAAEVDEELVRALSVVKPLTHGDPAAARRYASVLYQITGWEIFREHAEQAEEAAYAENAAEYADEDAERRQIARRRPPAWAGED